MKYWKRFQTSLVNVIGLGANLLLGFGIFLITTIMMLQIHFIGVILSFPGMALLVHYILMWIKLWKEKMSAFSSTMWLNSNMRLLLTRQLKPFSGPPMSIAMPKPFCPNSFWKNWSPGNTNKLITFITTTRDIHIEYSKQFKWNSYFYVSGQSRQFWVALKLL